MTDNTSRVIVTNRHEFLVPAEYRYGACWTDLMLAIRSAHNVLWDLGIVERGKDASDDQIRIFPGDDKVIVAVTLEQDASEDGSWCSVS